MNHKSTYEDGPTPLAATPRNRSQPGGRATNESWLKMVFNTVQLSGECFVASFKQGSYQLFPAGPLSDVPIFHE